MSVNRRGLIASALAFVYPGLGHAYLRTWARAFAWFALAIVTAALLLPDSAYQVAQQGGVMALVDYEFPLYVTVGVLAVRLATMVDAYRVAVQQSMPSTADATEEPACPVCGRALDTELDFCPWCTTELEWVDDADQYDSTR
ncbi:DUF7575 domain-containing protein [Halocalculus aciditolerans]|uniref:Zinc ribbon domain-containing protein n=1 Tax=Halocalculus aciditolerans TaxID=1383812 RepID=A0A830FGI0_9EURY|nr:zinc ribbon domain-containing protein [Halocalculus aciditolerans]GGL72237.1 zinc ribbon domain-containing protein [Halocalculus aciditolerans]